MSPSFEKISYLIQVAAIFDRLDAPFIVRVDGLGSEPEVQSRILALVHRFFHLPEKIASSSSQQPPTEP